MPPVTRPVLRSFVAQLEHRIATVWARDAAHARQQLQSLGYRVFWVL